MIEIDKLSPRSGRIVGEDGKVYNEVDILKTKDSEAQPVNEKTYDISQFSPRSGRIVGEDGRTYNEVDLLNGLTDKMEDIESEVTELSKLKNWLGETTTPITVGSTMNPITIDGVSVMANAGDVIAYDNGTTKNEFIFSEAGTWQVYDDKLDVYTKDETDELLDTKVDKVQGKNLSTNDFTNAYKNKVDSSEALLVDNAAKNLLLLTLGGIKKASENDDGMWDDNVYSENGINFAIATDDVERATSITVSQTAGAAAGSLSLVPSTIDPETLDIIYDPTYSAGDYIFSVGGSLPDGVDLVVSYEGTSGSMMQYVHDEAAITLAEGSGCLVGIYVRSMTIESGEPVIFDDFVIRPMFRRAGTNADFEVGYRTQKQLDAALTKTETDIASVQNGLASKLDKAGGQVAGHITTTQTEFTEDQQLVTKKYVDDNAGTASYNDLTNKPSINNVTLSGNKTLDDLGIGGHDNYTETILWENEGTTNPASINLPDSIKNYDMVAMRTLLANDIAPAYLTIPVDQLYADSAFICFNNGAGNLMGTFNTDGTVYTTHNASLSSRMILGQIAGIRLGARKPYKETVLYDQVHGSASARITLSENAANFDKIVAVFSRTNGGEYQNETIIAHPSTDIASGQFTSQNDINWYFTDNGSTFGWNNTNGFTLRKVIGINYGGSVKGRHVQRLYNSTVTGYGTITLTESVNDYDELYVDAWYTGNNVKQHIAVTVPKFNLTIGETHNVGYGSNIYLTCRVTDSTGEELELDMSNGLTVSAIYGIKYDSDYITIDTEMSDTSENPVQNKVVKAYVDALFASIVDGNEVSY